LKVLLLSHSAEFKHVADELRKIYPEVFLLANMTEFGKTPIIPLEEFAKIGYNCVIYPVSTLRIAMKAIEGFLDALKAEGSVESSIDKMQTREELYKLLEYKSGEEWMYPTPTNRQFVYKKEDK